MRLPSTKVIVVGDVRFTVRWAYGLFKQLQECVQGAGGDDLLAAKAVEGWLVENVVAVEGLEDGDGKPITRLSAEVLDMLPPDMLTGLMEGLQQAVGFRAPEEVSQPGALVGAGQAGDAAAGSD